jgi:hypothetical protein
MAVPEVSAERAIQRAGSRLAKRERVIRGVIVQVRNDVGMAPHYTG